MPEPIDSQATPAPVEEERFWNSVLSPGWRRRGSAITMRIALRFTLLLSPDDAEDILSESLRRCILWARVRGLEKVNPEETRRVLHGIIQNVIRENIRTRSRRPGDYKLLKEQEAAVYGAGTNKRDCSDLKESIERCMKFLSAPEREILRMKYHNGYSQTEIAEKLKMSEAGVSRAIHHIRFVFSSNWKRLTGEEYV